MKRQHVQQKVDDGDCGIAVVSIATAKPYDLIIKENAPADVYQHGTWVVEMQRLLEKIEKEPWSSKYYSPMRVFSRYNFLKEDTILGIYKPSGHFHWILTDGEFLYDPLLPNKINLEEAKLGYQGEWTIYVELRR